jgi:FkbH-like protein
MKPSIAILSNINIDPLKSNLLQSGFGTVYSAGYNQWQSEFFNSSSHLYSQPFDYVLLYLHPDALQKEEFELSTITESIEHFLEKQAHGTVLLCELTGRPLYVDTFVGNASENENNLNLALYAFSANHARVRMVPVSQLIRLHGYNTLFDDKYWYLGRMKLSFTGNQQLAKAVFQLTRAIEGKSGKVLVLDLDNTLWGGVLGEDGWQNITLSNEGKGLIYKEFQQCIVALKNTGVVLALCSKNNEAEVREAFEKHPDMVLQWDDFVSTRINWLSKNDNLLAISRELNVGPDTLVFIDDSPIERTLIRQSIPELSVPDFPTEVSKLTQWFLEEVVYCFFARTHITQEDNNKTIQYQRNAHREEVRKAFNYDDFLHQLNMEIQLHEASESNIARIAQLTQKTNQFNLSLQRYTEGEIESLFHQGNWHLYTCSYRDKFGDEGIVGAVLIQAKGSIAEIDNFLLSCRALGRRVEFTIMDQLKNNLQKKGFKQIRAIFNSGEKNIPAQHFYSDCGFTKTTTNQFEQQL